MIEIISDLIQGTQAWLDFRKNKVSATDAYDLINGMSIQSILERKQQDSFSGSKATERGHLLEAQARDLYANLHNVEVKEAGAIINSKYDNAMISPDGIVSEDGLIEIKSFEEAHHENVIENLDAHLIAQVQFQLFISERKWVDFVAFNPEEQDINKAYVEIRFFPDEQMFKKFEKALTETTDNSQIQNKALQIINLQQQLAQLSDEVKARIQFYNDTKAQIENLKQEIKQSTQGKIKETVTLGDDKLTLSVYDTNRVTVADETLVPEEYTTTIQVENVFQAPNGKFYQRVPNSKLAGNEYKAGKELPPGFKVSTSRSISIKFNGETL